ncbi:MAG: Cyclic di-GMP phosphodiesterase response regulator RpfG [bacterium ADurb.Bin236]|nr:MAG: Cyclic di-GMP phosphodiesterase response regulator RpfG [bacterium ADurb.Bin236]HOY63087.1 HD domain-containing phosphohydrolase [bacterium]HPN94306.1 HD domain-containing phosphohydrolase [bacterium]
MSDNEQQIKLVLGQPLEADIVSADRSVVLVKAGTMVTQDLMMRLTNWLHEQERLREKQEKTGKKGARHKMRWDILKKLEFEQIVSDRTRKQLEKGCENFFSTIGKKGSPPDIAALEDAVQTMVSESPDNPDMPLKLLEMKKHSSYLFQHAMNCGVIATFVATALKYPTREIAAFALAMMLHDTGLLTVNPDSLNKMELSEKELVDIRNHPRSGYDALRTIPGVDPLALLVAIGHHVYADGSGYPDNVDFHDLPELAHLAVIINDFESLTSEKPLSEAIHMHEAIVAMLRQSEKYHPVMLSHFIRAVGFYPVTTFAQLNTGEVGVVVRNNPENLFLPEIKLVMDENGKRFPSEISVDLMRESDRWITRIKDNI